MKGRKRSLKSVDGHDFKTLAKRAHNAREKIRYLAFAHMQEGKSNIEIARMLKVNRIAISDWIKRFNNNGIEGLKERKGRGAKLKLDTSQREAFRKSVLELQEQRAGGRIKGSDVKKLMEEKFGIKHTMKSVYNELHRVNLVWISGRSKHPKADVEAQEDFKKTLEK